MGLFSKLKKLVPGGKKKRGYVDPKQARLGRGPFAQKEKTQRFTHSEERFSKRDEAAREAKAAKDAAAMSALGKNEEVKGYKESSTAPQPQKRGEVVKHSPLLEKPVRASLPPKRTPAKFETPVSRMRSAKPPVPPVMPQKPVTSLHRKPPVAEPMRKTLRKARTPRR